MGLLGDLTVTEVRARGEELLAEIVETTALSLKIVHRRLDGAHGKAKLRSVFVDEWPDLAGELKKETVAGARAKKLSDTIARVTKLDHRTVEFVLDQASARTRVSNAFDFAWPGKAGSEEREESLRNLLSNQSVATIRKYDLFEELAAVFGLDEQVVRNSLSAHRGHKLLKNIRLDAAPVVDSVVDGDGAGLSDADEDRMLSFLPGDGAAIGNGNLRDKLGWDEDRYFLVRAGLLQKGSIWLGKGRGGSVMLASGWVESRRKELFALVPEDGTAVSNATLMRELGWEEPFYHEIKQQLVEEGLLQVGMGRGGTVSRTLSSSSRQVSPGVNSTAESSATVAPAPIELFFSYSHKDEDLRDELDTHLAPLRREGLISQWHDRCIGAGQEWKEAIDERLGRADIVLLLISPNFIASDYCYDIEMTVAINRVARGEAVMIPVIIRPCDWNKAPFARFQALPKGAKPVTRWEDRDEAWLDVVRGLRSEVQKFAARRKR